MMSAHLKIDCRKTDDKGHTEQANPESGCSNIVTTKSYAHISGVRLRKEDAYNFGWHPDHGLIEQVRSCAGQL